jgi:hypothetical protein
MNFRDYYFKIESLLKEFSLVTHFSVDFEEIEDYIGYIKGKLELMNGSTIFFFEFIEVKNNVPVLVKYKYQWQSPDGDLLKRWDNAPHHKELNSFPDHVHDCNGVYSSPAMSLESILDYCLNIK